MIRERPTILFVSLSGWLGGPGRSLATLLAHLPEEIELVLACPPVGDLLPTVRQKSNFKAHVPLVRRRGPVPDPLGRARLIFQLIGWILRNKRTVTAIHANGYGELNIVAPAAILSRTPVVVWLHGFEIRRWDMRLGRLWRLVLTPTVTAVSSVAARTATGSGLTSLGSVRIVPNPIDPEDCLGESLGQENIGRRDCVVVGYLAATNARKGFRLLPDIIGRVGDASIRWVVFAARPNDRTGPEELIWSRLEALRPRIAFEGWQTSVGNAYRMCDIILCPSAEESFSRIPAEAMLNGLPVVASDIEPHRALLAGPDPAGLLFAIENLDMAADHIRRLAADPSLRMALGRAGQSRAGAFSPGEIAARFAVLYRQAESSRSRR
jgi:glycosyltransferase involved in cell wall biosynthesis